MSNRDIPYIIYEGSGYGSGFIVWDQKEEREICGCTLRKDAELIAGSLNKPYEQIKFENMGYRHVKQMKNEEWIGILSQFFTHALCVGLDEFGYKRRYCYEFSMQAIIAAKEYEGENDPSGPWIKVKGEGEERMGPGAIDNTVRQQRRNNVL